jgi:hypothetical protein
MTNEQAEEILEQLQDIESKVMEYLVPKEILDVNDITVLTDPLNAFLNTGNHD